MAKKIIKKEDLIKAKQELKLFRHNVAILKKKGILKKELYDARTVIPTNYLKSQIKKFNSVIDGTAQAVKVSAEKKNYYEEKGYLVTVGKKNDGFVIVPVRKNEKAFSYGGDFRVRLTGVKGGSTVKIDVPMDTTNINTLIESLKNNEIKLKSDEVLAVQLWGNNMHKVFHPSGGLTAQERLAIYLLNYEQFDEITGNNERAMELAKGLVIFKVTRDKKTGEYIKPEKNSFAKEKDAELTARHRERDRVRREKRMAQMTDKAYEKYMDEKAEDARARRKEMSGSELAAYREKARARAAKSRAKKQS